jgi:hypothetical protein
MRKYLFHGGRPHWTRRFLTPLLLVVSIWALLEIVHTNTWKLGIPCLTLIAGWIGGLGGFFYQFLSPLLTWPMTYFRQASLFERTIASLSPVMAECCLESMRAGLVYSPGESLYYSLGQVFLFVMCVNLSLMGFCEILCRLKAGVFRNIRIWSPGPFIAMSIAPLAAWVMLIWEGGVHWFYLYQEGYKFLF